VQRLTILVDFNLSEYYLCFFRHNETINVIKVFAKVKINDVMIEKHSRVFFNFEYIFVSGQKQMMPKEKQM